MGQHDEDAEVDCDGDVCAPSPQTIPVDSVTKHEKYDPEEMINDIAILKLKSSVKINGEYTCLCIFLSIINRLLIKVEKVFGSLWYIIPKISERLLKHINSIRKND